MSSALALSVTECALRRSFGTPPMWRFPQEAYEPDARLVWRLRPNQDAFTHGEPVHTNALGLRDRDYGPKPPGTRRILALGDSQTFGLGLALADSWPKQLERDLRESDGGRWEVVNAGVPATDVWQHERMMRELVPELDPDDVVLAFYVNDVSVPVEHPVFPLTPPSPWLRRIGYALRRSAILLAARTAVDALGAAWHGPPPGQLYESHLLAGASDPAVERGWKQVETSLGAMAELARSRGIDLTVVALPRRDQVSGATDGHAYEARLAAIASAERLRFVDVLPRLQRAYAVHGDALFVPWDGHDGALANREIALAIREELLGGGHELRR